jgi:hypothetical protein
MDRACDIRLAPRGRPEQVTGGILIPALLRILLAVVFGTLLSSREAAAESGYCRDLRAQIAKAGSEGLAARYRAAAAKQRQEYGKLAARARAMGCDRQQFLFFGDPPPPQCGPLNARLSALQGSIAAYDHAGADDSQRQALMARYESECRNPQATAREPQPRSFFEELFGVEAPDQEMRQVPVGPPETEEGYGEQPGDERPRGGPMAICVRECDGGFFPITYSARSANLDDLDGLCKAMCPGAEAKLYTQSQWKGLDSALSIEGEPYSDHPNAYKFEKSFDPSCGCKPPGKSWAEALADAEQILAERNKKDQMITAEQAEQMSRPVAPAAPRAARPGERAPPPGPAANDARGREKGDAPSGGTREIYREVVGPDGVKRRIRVVAPTL